MSVSVCLYIYIYIYFLGRGEGVSVRWCCAGEEEKIQQEIIDLVITARRLPFAAVLPGSLQENDGYPLNFSALCRCSRSVLNP